MKINLISFRWCTIWIAFICQFSTYQASNVQCGRVRDIRFPLILGGNQTIRGQWPFVVALHKVKVLEYICGGTLISTKHVLTAAHCIQGKYSVSQLMPTELLVRLGAYNLTNIRETGAVNRTVSEIILHPDWEVYEDDYDADIAILVLSDHVPYSNNIRPVCLPFEDDATDISAVGVDGYVVGWGLADNNNTHEEIPKQTVVTALNDTYCYISDSLIVPISSSSQRSFCGMGVGGSPNKGDSGGGFFVHHDSTWVQHGIVSTIRTNGTGFVDIKAFSVYTKVNNFKNWITGVITPPIILKCQYRFLADEIYGCSVDAVNMVVEYVATFTGSHLPGKSDEDVKAIEFGTDGSTFFLPNGIGKFFSNLQVLRARCTDTKIHRSNFKNMETLEELDITFVHNELLNEETFWDLQNLVNLTIAGKVKMLHKNTFEENARLIKVKVSHGLESFHKNIFRNNSLLQDVDFSGNELKLFNNEIFQNNLLLKKVNFSNNSLYALFDGSFQRNIQLLEVDLSMNQIYSTPSNLFQNNLMLQKVNFSSNRIRSLSENTFETNTQLKQVDLSKNEIEFIQKNLFHNNLLLKEINIANNKLQVIEIDFFRFEQIDDINLFGNVCFTICFYRLLDEPKCENMTRNLQQLQTLLNFFCKAPSPLLAYE